ncbi:endonuclease domain-containing 1 protein-like [Alosa pseudoharengus]|uniref:endonuclease domain-containing 1 protein-like n=1 Tax=Alosa pseudoharengus TaxID=34774 RepID=UPI003F8B81A9
MPRPDGYLKISILQVDGSKPVPRVCMVLLTKAYMNVLHEHQTCLAAGVVEVDVEHGVVEVDVEHGVVEVDVEHRTLIFIIIIIILIIIFIMKLIGLLLLLGLLSLVEGEVVTSFAATCPAFFIKDQNNRLITPTVLPDQNRYKQICQRYGKAHRYATLYDIKNRIPVYSAYTFAGYKSIDRKGSWMIEPQIDEPGASTQKDMTTSDKVPLKLRGVNQALPKDYEHSGYQIGHLYPHCHNCDQNQAESTFTLTNAAPQDGEDNTDWYGQVEKVSANMIYNWCHPGTGHVVTGVVPSNTWIVKNGVNRVNVPAYFWSAFCCQHRLTKCPHSKGFLALTKTGMKILYNDPKHDWKMVTEWMSVQDLNGRLAPLYSVPTFEVFGNVCV